MGAQKGVASYLRAMQQMRQKRGPIYERYLHGIKRVVDRELERLENERGKEQAQRASREDEEAT